MDALDFLSDAPLIGAVSTPDPAGTPAPSKRRGAKETPLGVTLVPRGRKLLLPHEVYGDPVAEAVVLPSAPPPDPTSLTPHDALGAPSLVAPADVTIEASAETTASGPVEGAGGEAVAPAPPTPAEVEIPDVLLQPLSWLRGPAGTGKTFLARAMTRQLPGTVLAATTGIAAVNLGEGTTINALLGYFDTESLRENHLSGRLGAQLGKLYKCGVRRILLDEVSMMDADQLTILTHALEELGGDGYTLDQDLADEIAMARGKEGLPIGAPPIALTLIGDFAQLPPVKAKFAFESPRWKAYADHVHTLTKIWRQADAPFIQALMAARRGEPKPVVDFFGPMMTRAVDDTFPGTTIFAKNDAVARYNAVRMGQLTTPRVIYVTIREGEQRTDWKKDIPDVLEVKEGALVMVLANQRTPSIDGLPGRLIYANGDLGTVERATPQELKVRLQRNDQVETIFPITRLNTIPLEPGRRKALRAEGKEETHITEDGKFEIVGSVTYTPVRVAYATTVHKSQGLTLDKVQLNLTEHFMGNPGMAYVALSRCRTAGGLRLVGTPEVLAKRISVNAKVKPWV